jgi:hypothetical protein
VFKTRDGFSISTMGTNRKAILYLSLFLYTAFYDINNCLCYKAGNGRGTGIKINDLYLPGDSSSSIYYVLPGFIRDGGLKGLRNPLAIVV